MSGVRSGVDIRSVWVKGVNEVGRWECTMVCFIICMRSVRSIGRREASRVWGRHVTNFMESHIVVKGGMLGGTRIHNLLQVHILINPKF